MAYIQARAWLFRALSLSLAVCWPSAQVHETITFLLVTLPNIHRLKFFFTLRLSNKPFLIRLLTTPPHLKYVATLPCNLSFIACLADINVSQCNVATYALCKVRWNFWYPFNCKFTKESSSEKKLLNRLRIYRMLSWVCGPVFWPTLYIGTGPVDLAAAWLFIWQTGILMFTLYRLSWTWNEQKHK